ncbi:hypothetical protein, partial [Pseudopedobacter sp.]|uniref:hypothetical protein n=1 Tax=Pseudopedobacter sp. TaxID=1936787 RepID=UPI00333F86CA
SYKPAGPKVPILFVNFLLQRIADLTGITLAGSFLEHPTWKQLILTNWRALDGATAITVNKHVPAWTIPNFLLELRKIPNLQLTFDSVEKRLTLDFWEQQLTKPAAKDWTDKAVAGHKKYHEINRRLHLAYSLDGGDGLMKDRPEVLEDYITPAAAVLGDVANSMVKVNFQLTTFPVDEITGLPVARQTGVTEEFNQLAVSTQPRLLFWHGIVSGKPRALPELDGLNLYLSEPDGLAERYWSNTEQQRLEMFYLQKDFILTETDLALFDFSEKIHYNGLDYLVASITGELPVVKPFTCLLVKA